MRAVLLLVLSVLDISAAQEASCGPAPMSMYQAVSRISAVPEVGHDLSGVSVNGDNGNLYFVRDNGDGDSSGTGTLAAGNWSAHDGGVAGTSELENPALWEFSVAADDPTSLTLVREIEMVGFDDIEAVAWMDNNRVAVLEEERMRICVLDLSDRVGSTSAQDTDCEKLITLTGLAADTTNGGGEGLGWDVAGNRFLVGKERDPLVVFAVPAPESSSADIAMDANNIVVNITAGTSEQVALNGVHWLPGTSRVMTLDYHLETVCIHGPDRDCFDLGLDQARTDTDDDTLWGAGHTYPNGVVVVPRSDDSNGPPDILVVSEPTIIIRYRAECTCGSCEASDTQGPNTEAQSPASPSPAATSGAASVASIAWLCVLLTAQLI